MGTARSRMRPEPSEMSDTMASVRPSRRWALMCDDAHSGRCVGAVSSTSAEKMSRPIGSQPALRPTTAAAPPTDAATAAPPARRTARRVEPSAVCSKPAGVPARQPAHTGRWSRSAVATAATTSATADAHSFQSGSRLFCMPSATSCRSPPPRHHVVPSASAHSASSAVGRTRSVRRVIRWPQRVQVITILLDATLTARAAPAQCCRMAYRERTRRCNPAVIVLVLLAARLSAALDIETARLVDLTHPFDDTTIYWPTARRFELDPVSHGRTPGGWWYAANDFCAAEHGGTHLDAPVHFAEGGWTADQIPLDRLRGPAAVVDVTSAARAQRDLLITVPALRADEAAHGRIPDGAMVLLRTG